MLYNRDNIYRFSVKIITTGVQVRPFKRKKLYGDSQTGFMLLDNDFGVVEATDVYARVV